MRNVLSLHTITGRDVAEKKPKTSMLFGDAKKVLQDICAEVKMV